VDEHLRPAGAAEQLSPRDRARRARARLARRLPHSPACGRRVRGVGGVRLLHDPVPRGRDEDPAEPLRGGPRRRRERSSGVLHGHAAGTPVRTYRRRRAHDDRRARRVRRGVHHDARRTRDRHDGAGVPGLQPRVPGGPGRIGCGNGHHADADRVRGHLRHHQDPGAERPMNTASRKQVALYYDVQALHLIDTYWALILVEVSGEVAFGVFWMRATFLAAPPSLLESARMDGASTWQVLWRIMVPFAWPSILTLVILTFAD